MFKKLIPTPRFELRAHPAEARSMQLESPFPLTPALSPGEREHFSTTFANSLDGDLACDCQLLSLSPGERAGLRGTAISELHGLDVNEKARPADAGVNEK